MKTEPAFVSPNAIQVNIAGRTFYVSRFAFLLIMGVLVGAVTGCVAVLFRLAAFYGEQLLFPYHGEPGQVEILSLAGAKRIMMPVAGGLISGLLLFRVWKFKGSHGITKILRSVASGQYHFEPRMAIPAGLAIVTIATGGSVGPEGPIAEIGSVTGSLIGRWAKVPPKLIKTLIGAGVAAGIAAVFNAPFGGVFFAMEVVLRNYEMASFTPIAIASVVASVIAQVALGDKMAIIVPPITIPQRELPWFAILGLLCGLISILYIYGLSWAHLAFKRLKLPMWISPAFGGLFVGLIGLFFPSIMGEGYDFMRQVLEHAPSLTLLLILMLLKIVATGITLGSGNPGGSFAPAVFIGIMGGAAFGSLLSMGGLTATATPYALLGMSGLIAGALGAPITAIMITLRNAGNAPTMLLPLMTTVALCIFVMQLRRNVSVYTHGFLKSGLDLDKARQVDPLSLVTVRTVTRVGGYEEIPACMPVGEALERFKGGLARWFVVRGEGGTFAGIASLHEMRLAIAEEELARLLMVEDILDPFSPRLHAEMSLREALVLFNSSEAEVLPVFASAAPGAPDASFLGVLSRQDTLNAYYEFTELA